jgi:hypothetical protein
MTIGGNAIRIKGRVALLLLSIANHPHQTDSVSTTYKPYSTSKATLYYQQSNTSLNNTPKMSSKLTIFAAWLLIASATAVPAPNAERSVGPKWEHDANWLPRGGNFSVPKNHALGMPKRSMDCNLSLPKRSAQCNALSAREENAEVKVLVYADSVMTFGHWGNLKKGEERPVSPPTFTNLWESVVAASCNSLECGKHIGKASTRQYMDRPQPNLEMWLEGDYWEEALRDEMVAVLRQAFDRAVVREYADNGYQMYEWGPKDLFAVRKTGQSLRLVLRTQNESEDGCGDIVSRILEMGELVSPLFGLVSVACATADM